MNEVISGDIRNDLVVLFIYEHYPEYLHSALREFYEEQPLEIAKVVATCKGYAVGRFASTLLRLTLLLNYEDCG